MHRGCRVLAVSETSGAHMLSEIERRMLSRLERPCQHHWSRAEREGPLAALYAARLIEVNGRLRPLRPRTPPADDPIRTVRSDALSSTSGSCFVDVGTADDLSPVMRALSEGVTAIPQVTVKRGSEFIPTFERLVEAGFRLFRLVPGSVRDDLEALQMARGYLDLVQHAADWARQRRKPLRLSGVDGWIRLLRGTDVPFFHAHPRCARCSHRGLCRPDLTGASAALPACTFTRHVTEELAWALADSPDIGGLIAGQR